jgi:glycosyltransferase involved in cell wall biosynthesis
VDRSTNGVFAGARLGDEEKSAKDPTEYAQKTRFNVLTMKACMLAYAFYESDNRVRRYAETLAKQGFQVDAVTLGKVGQPRYGNLGGVRICRIQKRVRDEKGKLSYLYKIVKFFFNSALFISKQHLRQRYDLIHVHSVPDFEVFATFFAKLTGAKIILDIHDIVPEFYAGKFHVSGESFTFKALVSIEKASIAFSDHVIIANHLWEKTIRSRSATKEKCTTMLNYPDTSIFYKRAKGWKKDKFVAIYPGTINWHQGLDIAVKAFAQIKADAPEAEFHIYGDGPMRYEIQQLIADLHLQDQVFLKGTLTLDQIAAAMVDADLGIVPKRNNSFGGEAFSTKILEFMALGVPVVAAATRIDRFYFNDSIVRFFEPENAQDLASAINDMIRNRELRERLSSSAMAFVSNFTWDKKEKEYLSLVDRLISVRG